MNIPKFMALFHLSFLSVGLSTLFAMIVNAISLDWWAFLIIVTAILLNAFFGVLWIHEAGGRTERVQKAPVPLSFRHVFPMVSFVVTAYNDEQGIAQCINNLFRCAEEYRGPSEIIIIDNGSTDNTFDVAWATIGSMRTGFLRVPATVLRYTASLNKDEAVRTGVNKAMGEYIVMVDAAIVCEPESFNDLVDNISATGKKAVSNEDYPSKESLKILQGTIRLYRAAALRHELDQNQVSNVI